MTTSLAAMQAGRHVQLVIVQLAGIHGGISAPLVLARVFQEFPSWRVEV